MKLLVIFNPGSRSGKAADMRGTWETCLQKSGIEYKFTETTGQGSAFRAAASPGNYDVVAAAGGDGTINEVIDGLCQSSREDIAFAVLYSGTSPDFCKFHKIPLIPEKAVASLISGRTAKIDIAEISHADNNGKKVLSHFGCSCNIGLGADIASYSNKVRKYLGDTLGTFTAALRSFIKNSPFDVELELDGEQYRMENVNNLTVLKNPHIASGLKLSLELQPDDGKLYVAAVKSKSRIGLLKTLPGFYTGNAAYSEDIFLKPCASVEIRTIENREIEFDGDPKGLAPVSIKILPEKLKLIGGGYE